MENLSLIILSIGIGISLQRIKTFENAANTLNQYVIYVALPALIWSNLPQLEFSAQIITAAVTPWLALLLSLAILGLLQMKYQWEKPVYGAMLLLLPLGNTSFLGIPMIHALFGPEGTAYAVVYDQLGSFLILSIYAPLIIGFYQANSPSFSWINVLNRVIRFPPFIALLITLLCLPLNKPLWLSHNMQSLSQTLAPIAMIAVGLQLRFRFPEGVASALIWGFLLKLLIVPTILFASFYALSLEGLIVEISIFEAAMPSMIAAGILASNAGFHAQLISAWVAWGVLLSLITLPAWAWLIQTVF